VLRVVVALTGASGAIYGVRLLEVLGKRADVETHLVISKGARATLAHELDMSAREVGALATEHHSLENLGATIASGSFQTAGMVIAPCSVATLSAIAHSSASSLLTRAADVTLKERRPLVLLLRETPLHAGHIRLMLQAAEAGATIMPPVPAFYTHPASVKDVVDHTVGRALDQLGIANDLVERWSGLADGATRRPEDLPGE
jgi:flavin prenyltransferase